MTRIIDLRKKATVSEPPAIDLPAQAEKTPTVRPEQAIKLAQLLEEEMFTWDAPPGTTPERTGSVLLIILFVFIMGAFAFQRNFLAMLFGALAAVVFLLQGRRSARSTSIALDESGFVIGNRTYGFHALRSFWITATPGGPKELSLEFKTRFLPYLKVPLGPQDPVPLRLFLSAYLPEQEHEPSLVDELMRSLGA